MLSHLPDTIAENQHDKEVCLADWAMTLKRSVLRQMIAVVSRPGILSFAGGLPDPALFPLEGYGRAMSRALTDPQSLQYKPPYEPLKRHIVQLMAQRGVTCREEQVFITSGAQQALDVLSRLLLNPGGPVLLEEVVYTGIQQAVASLQPQVLSVKTDLSEGMDVAGVAHWLEAGHRPAFIYVIPEAHNPLGVSLSATRREQLVALARQYGVPIVEDDPYGLLVYDGRAFPPLRALDDQWVFYAGSFSKIIAPALRLGWLVAPEALVPKLTVVKEAGDLESSALTQRAVSYFLDEGELESHLDHVRAAYRERRDAMLHTLDETFPAGTRWTAPAGGMFVWVELPRHVHTPDLLQQAMEQEQIAFIPGHAFAVAGCEASHCMRLTFASASPEQIEDGITRLARVVRDFIAA